MRSVSLGLHNCSCQSRTAPSRCDFGRVNCAGVTGLEPATYGFGDRCATNCATPLRSNNSNPWDPVTVQPRETSIPCPTVVRRTGGRTGGTSVSPLTHRLSLPGDVLMGLGHQRQGLGEAHPRIDVHL